MLVSHLEKDKIGSGVVVAVAWVTAVVQVGSLAQEFPHATSVAKKKKKGQKAKECL